MNKADNVKAPQGDGSADTNMVLFDTSATSQAHKLPKDLKGKFVTVTAYGGTIWFFFSTNASAVVDKNLTALAAGRTSAQLGKKLLADSPRDIRLPQVRDDQEIYFVRQAADTTPVVEIWGSSD